MYQIREAAEKLGVSIDTLRRWEKEGKLKPTCRTKGGHRRYSIADLTLQNKIENKRIRIGSRFVEQEILVKKDQIIPLTLANQVYQHLKKRIIDQQLKPGSRLIVSHIAAELGTSLTPVREALTTLAKDGLVEMFPHKGACVTKPTKKNFEDLFNVRKILEGFAVKLAAPRLTPADIQTLDEIIDKGDSALSAGDSESWIEMDVKLHNFIARKSGNGLLIEFLSSIQDRIHIFRLLTVGFPDRVKKVSQEHWAIVSALREKDVESAEKLIVEHIENTFQMGIEG